MEKSRNFKSNKYGKKKYGNINRKYAKCGSTNCRNKSYVKRKKTSNFFVFLMMVLFIILYMYAFMKATGIEISNFYCSDKVSKVEKLEEIQAVEAIEKIEERETYIIRCETVAGVQEVPLEDFLVLALGANIDMGYELETLKAQTVLLRGNCIRIMEENMMKSKEKVDKGKENVNEKRSQNSSGTVSDNGVREANEHQIIDATQLDFSYYSLEELKIVWGNKYDVYYQKAKEAVMQTKGIYAKSGAVTLNGNFHAMSAGKTRSGEEVLGEDYVYLQSVSCEKNLEAKNFIQTKYFEASETSKLQILKRDEAGYVTKVSWNGKTYSGEKIRQALGLASANFEVENGEHYRITTKGIGHGFGFDQYYANYMAEEMQMDYMKLILYFYKDVSFAIL